jgi:valyl-tRNA synthetase
VPWKHAVISGWVVQRNVVKGGRNEKISKSKEEQGGAIVRSKEKPKPIPTPKELLDTYTADGVRYWAANARLGVDTTFDDKALAQGKRLVTKIFNASKFVLAQTAEPGPIVRELDRGFLYELKATVGETTASFAEFEFAPALKSTEGFFWGRFTDSYVELAKVRARAEDDPEGRVSAVAALRRGLSVLLRLFAPVLPYITEEVWSWAIGPELASHSIHDAGWPGPADFADVRAPEVEGSFAAAVEALAAVNRAKTAAGVGIGRGALSLELAANAENLRRLAPVLPDVLAAGRIRAHTLTEAEVAAEGGFEVRAVEFEPKPAK